jgi:hypothetical protein
MSGYFIPPSVGKTQIVRNYPSAQIVNTGDHAVHRIVPVYFSSINPCNSFGATGPNWTANLSTPLRGVVGTRFLSIQIDYLPDMRATPNQTAFVWLNKFPREGVESYHETSGGTRYSAKFPLPSTRLCDRRLQYEYIFTKDYELDMLQISQTVQKINFRILYEDSVTGIVAPFTTAQLGVVSLELGFIIEERI